MMALGQPASIGDLLRRVAEGRWGPHADCARELLAKLQAGLQARGSEVDTGDDAMRFNWDLPNVRLHGCSNIAGLIVGGNGSEADAALRGLATKASAPGRLLLVLAPSDSAAETARQVMPPDRCLVLAGKDLRQILIEPEPLETFKRRLRAQIPFLWLVPYNTTLPALPGMFFGRRLELEKLLQQDQTSFAIVGPSKIGKTSLLKQYRRELVVKKDSRVHRFHEIDFYDYRGASEDVLARFIAMRIASSSRSDRMTLADLPQFLHLQSSLAGAPLELVLDEVDEVCLSDTFDVLAEAARKNHCRIIVSGKGNLLRLLRSPDRILAGRLVAIRPEPLTLDEARALLLEPFRDLDLQFAERGGMVEQILALTSRLPYLIQSFARRLIEAAYQEDAKAITVRHLEKVRGDFMSMVYSIGPLDDLTNPAVRAGALLILRCDPRDVSVPLVQDLFRREGVTLRNPRVKEICEELVICNILIWEQDHFQLANPAMAAHARRMGLLEAGLQRSLAEVRQVGSTE